MKLVLITTLVVSYKIADENFFYNFDLNRVSRIELEDFWNEYFSDDFSEDQCVAMLDLLFHMRSKGVFIKNMDSIDWPQSVEDRLHSMNQFFHNATMSVLQKKYFQSAKVYTNSLN